MKNMETNINISKLKEKLLLNGNVIKVIAIIAMTIDHLAWMGIAEYSQAETIAQIFFALHRKTYCTYHVLLCS